MPITTTTRTRKVRLLYQLLDECNEREWTNDAVASMFGIARRTVQNWKANPGSAPGCSEEDLRAALNFIRGDRSGQPPTLGYKPRRDRRPRSNGLPEKKVFTVHAKLTYDEGELARMLESVPTSFLIAEITRRTKEVSE